MCGIIGFIGNKEGMGLLLDGLTRLEYRGYDSCGVACSIDGNMHVIKSVGRVEELENKIKAAGLLDSNGTIGIGHTRWATHGKVNVENSHPHQSNSGRFILVHNGVIENYKELKDRFCSDIELKSSTDTEIIVQMIEVFSKKLSTRQAFLRAISLLEGSYALALIDQENQDELLIAKNKSPILIGRDTNSMLVGSDALAMISHTNKFIEVLDGDVIALKNDSYEVIDSKSDDKLRKVFTSQIDPSKIDKGIYEDYMLKEINEQPSIIRGILKKYYENDSLKIDSDILSALDESDNVYLIGCGTSYHAGLIGANYLEKYGKIRAGAYVASEFAYNTPLLSKKPIFILISQSGETADLRAVMTKLRDRNKDYKFIIITNVPNSTLAREGDHLMELNAKVEIAVASTKAYTAELTVLSLLSYALGKYRGFNFKFDIEEELSKVANAIETILDDIHKLELISKEMLVKQDCFYIGRGLSYYTALEAALKLKEISYIRALGIAGGELKHGSIALIEEDTPVIAIIANTRLELITRGNVSEVRSRGAKVLVITMERLARGNDYAIPNVYEDLSVIPLNVVAQLLAYYTAKNRGLDVDKPRNLAKSVTVE